MDETRFWVPKSKTYRIAEPAKGIALGDNTIPRKMLSYALGRQLEYFDEPAVRTILRAFKSKGYRMHTLIQQICLSYPFLYKRDPIPAERQEDPLAPGS